MKLRPTFYVLILLVAFPFSWATTQNCSCSDEGSCPQTVGPGQTVQICYDIVDAVNNDLGDSTQGICGVSLAFQHGNIEALSITLVSPAGQAVNLVGAPCNGPTTTTIFSNWYIHFAPCAMPAFPDTIGNTTIANPWDNCNDNNVWPIAQYTGTYHPHAGCLENFNTGPVNGSWCLLIQNTSNFYSASIIDFAIELCDDTGIFCCEANAGSLSSTTYVFCTSDTLALHNFNPQPSYSFPPPDSSLYGYTWAVAQDDSLHSWMNPLDLSALDTGQWTICGLSYLWADSTQLPAAGTTTLTALSASLSSDTTTICAALTPQCIQVQLVSPADTSWINTSLCMGDTLWVGDSALTHTGHYQLKLSSWANCDSIVDVTLQVFAPDTLWIDTALCVGDTLLLADSAWWATGQYQLNLLNQYGCDSTLMIQLLIHDSIQTLLVDTICAGDSYPIGDSSYTQTGTYLHSFTSYLGCDSLVQLQLTVWHPQALILPPDTLTCMDTTIWLNGSPSVGTSFLWTTADGSIRSSPDSLLVLIDAPGTYVLHAWEAFCESTDTIVVTAHTTPPYVDAGPDTTLDCTHSQINLSASVTTQGAPFNSWWIGPNANTPIPDTGLVVTATTAGSYMLFVRNSYNGCMAIDTVYIGIDTIAPVVMLPDTQWLTCFDTSISLTANITSSAGITLQWLDPQGQLVPYSDTNSLVVTQAGWWQLVAINDQNGCIGIDSTVVQYDTIPPTALVAPSETITCALPIQWLDASASQQAISYEWIGPQNPLPDSVIVPVHIAGTYILVAHAANGCTDTASIVVPADTIAPIADAGPDRTLVCGYPQANIGGNTTSTGSTFTYSWYTQDGHFVGPTDVPVTTVDSAGVYVLTVTNTTNGCTDSDTVVVSAWLDPPIADAGPDLSIDCQTPTATLDASASSSGTFIGYSWYTLSGDFLSNSPQITVNYPDTFVLTVQNTFTFCESTDTVIVWRTADAPLAEAGPPKTVDCYTATAVLDGSGSDAGPHVLYQWTALQGAIVADSTSITPQVVGPGMYLLSLFDTANGCIAIDTTFTYVDSMACMPIAHAGPDGHITCAHAIPADTLDATGSTQAPTVVYEWTALGGQVLSLTDSLRPVVISGLYVLEVRNTLWNLSAFDTVLVTIDTIHPIADAGPSVQWVSCAQLDSCYLLGGPNTSVGPRLRYTWQAVDIGGFCTETNGPTAGVNTVGWYTLTVLDTVNHCSSEDAVWVQYDGPVPQANAGPDIQIACGDSTALLDASASLQDSAFTYTWYAPNGVVVPTTDPLTAIGQPLAPADTFFLVVQSNQNSCSDTDAVVVFAPVNCYPLCAIATPNPLTCVQDSIWLDGSLSDVGPAFSYQWTALSGHICGGDSTLSPCVDEEGIYQLKVTNTLTNFSSTCQVVVEDLRLPPQVEAGPPIAITCGTPQPTLTGSYSPQVDVSAMWYTPNGQLEGDIYSLQVNAVAPGTYYLTVVRADNGCSATDSVIVAIDTLAPQAEAGPAGQIDCATSTVVLAGSATPSDVSYFWYTNDGDICAGQTTPNPVVCAAGTYTLVVTASNGCSDSDTTTVTIQDGILTCHAGPDFVYTCTDTFFTLQGSVQGGNLVTATWSSPDGGVIISGAQSLTPQVASPGTYVLEVQDLVTGCSCTSVAKVLADTVPPQPLLPDSLWLTCEAPAATIDATSTTSGHPLTYNWSGPIVLPDSPIVVVDQVGTYLLTLTDGLTGCSSTDSTIVTSEMALPIADAGPDTSLTCTRTSLTIQATAAPNLSYSWYALEGSIDSDSFQIAIEVSTPGTYVLQVTDTLNGCTQHDTVRISADTLRPMALIATPQGTVLNCYHPYLLLDGAPSQPTDSISFKWYGPGLLANTPQWTTSDTGHYQLVVAHLRNGCTDTASAYIAQDFAAPQITWTASDTLSCEVTQVALAIQPLPPPDTPWLYQWSSIPPGHPIGHSDSAVVIISEVATYQATVTNAITGCATVTTIVPPFNLSAPIVEATAVSPLTCDQPHTTLLAKVVPATPALIVWTSSNGDTLGHFPALSVEQAGWYYLQGINTENGCSGRDSVFVSWASPPMEGIWYHIQAPPCAQPDWSATLVIDSVAGGTGSTYYSLDGGPYQQDNFFTLLSPGNYQLEVVDEAGCSLDTVILISDPLPLSIAIDGAQEVLLGDSLYVQVLTSVDTESVASLQWIPPVDSSCVSPCFGLWLAPKAALELEVLLTDENGCTASARHFIKVRKDGPLYAPTAFSPNGDGYNERFTLYGGPQVSQIELLEVFARWGTLVFHASGIPPNDPTLGWDGTYRGQPLDSGVYVWRAEIRLIDGSLLKLRGEVALVR